jgi:hypothetical protein
LAVVAMATVGCGPDRPELVEVSGRITLNGDPWPAPGTLYFAPVESAGNLPLRPGTASFDRQGHFTVHSFNKSNGLIPGRYRIGVECWKVKPNMEGRPTVSYIDGRFENPQTSGLEVTIEPGEGATHLELDLPGEIATR